MSKLRKDNIDDCMGATDGEIIDSFQEDVAFAFKTCNQQRKRIACLESKNAALKAQVEMLSAPVCEHKWVCRLDQQQCMEDCHGKHDLICDKCGAAPKS